MLNKRSSEQWKSEKGFEQYLSLFIINLINYVLNQVSCMVNHSKHLAITKIRELWTLP